MLDCTVWGLHWSDKKLSLLKWRVILIVVTLLNPIMTTKLPYQAQVLRERGLNKKNYVCNKK
jgi:hypothetical protein